jgi:RimJ/RimL family protein N-acetyltransferase
LRDAPVVVAAYRDPLLRRWSPWGVAELDVEGARTWIADRIQLWETGFRASFAVCDATTGAVEGAVELRGLEHRQAGIASYWTLPAARGRGIAPLALGVVGRWAFSPREAGGLGLHRIELTHAVGNTASCRVATKAGYRQEGLLRESRRYADGEYHDEHLHARIVGDP